MRRRGNAVFVAINFWDVVCLLLIATNFDFGVVAISFFFAFRVCFAELSAKAEWKTTIQWLDRDRHQIYEDELADIGRIPCAYVLSLNMIPQIEGKSKRQNPNRNAKQDRRDRRERLEGTEKSW